MGPPPRMESLQTIYEISVLKIKERVRELQTILVSEIIFVAIVICI